MSFFVSVAILVISMVILGFLQLAPGIYMLVQHYARGKFSYKRASLTITYYMLGVEAMAAVALVAALLTGNLFFIQKMRPETSFLGWVMTGIIVALALISMIGYFRRGAGTKLFIPRRAAEALGNYARNVEKRSDAFALGALTSLLELPFTLPLYLLGGIFTVELAADTPVGLFLGLGLALAPVFPLVVLRLKYRNGYHLADLQRARVHNKNLIRLVLCVGYVLIAVLLICFGIQYGRI